MTERGSTPPGFIENSEIVEIREILSKSLSVSKRTEIYHNMVNDGGALIVIEEDSTIKLYEIPLYGGEPAFIQFCKSVQHARDIADTWT